MNGIWTKEDAEHHQSSLKFAQWLYKYLPNDAPIFDFGCGNGYYMAYLENYGFDAVGIDGNSDIDILCKWFIKEDLTQKYIASRKVNVISLEVGEHIDKAYQENFMQTLCDNCDKHLILSWASIGQPGIGHINCRAQSEVIADVESRGFKLNEAATKDGRANVDSNTDWLQRNLLVFERND